MAGRETVIVTQVQAEKGPPFPSGTYAVANMPVTTTPVGGGTRDWHSGICGCCEDPGNAAFVYFCTPCFACMLSNRGGEHCCMPLCVPGGLIALRTKIRLVLGIEGSICKDCCMMCCCGLCACCQMSRELDYVGWPK